MEDLFRKESLMDFWPSATQTAKERVDATSRFIIYATILVFVIRRDPRVIALGALVIGVLYLFYMKGMVPDGPRAIYASPSVKGITMPTMNNPMGNYLLGDPTDKDPAAWYPSVRQEVKNEWNRIHPFEKVRDAERNFYTTASTTIPNDQTAFAQAAYGRPFAPQCRDTPEACDSENNFYSRFPERVQLRGGNGTSR